MTTSTLQRTPITEIEDIVNGCGLPVRLGEILVTCVETGNRIFRDGKSYSSLVISFEPTLIFEAGYEMSGNYLLTARNKNPDISSTEKLLKQIKTGYFNLDIEYANDMDMPYDNWSITAYNEEILREIEQVCGDCTPDIDDELFYEVNEAFSFGYDMANEEVAYSLKRSLSGTQIPYAKTGFTSEFVSDFHVQLRQAICDFLLASVSD